MNFFSELKGNAKKTKDLMDLSQLRVMNCEADTLEWLI